MRAFLSVGRVTLDYADLRAFARRWPCSGLEGVDAMGFTFAENGDLVDYDHSPRSMMPDEAAVHALSEDAQRYLEKRRFAATRVAARSKR